MSKPSRRTTKKETTPSGESISSAAATPAKPTASPAADEALPSRSPTSSSALLAHFARALCSARTQWPDAVHRGHGGVSVTNLSDLDTLFCLSASGRVPLGLSIDGKGCSCSGHFPTPTATDWKGGHDRHSKYNKWNLRDFWRRETGWRYMPVEALTAAQGFPATWMLCEA